MSGDEKKNDFPKFMITWIQLNEFVTRAIKLGSKEEVYVCYDDENIDVEGFSSEMNEITKANLETCGMSFDKEGVMIDGKGDNPMLVLERVSLYSCLVHQYYDGRFEFINKSVKGHERMNEFLNNFVWHELLGCSSDGDIDYNGSYLDVLADTIKEYLLQDK